MKKPKSVSAEDWKAVGSPPLGKSDFAKMRPASEVVPRIVEIARRSRGRPKQKMTKALVSIRLSPKVIEHFRAQGPGWQTRVNHVLEYVVIGAKDQTSRAAAAKKLWAYGRRKSSL